MEVYIAKRGSLRFWAMKLAQLPVTCHLMTIDTEETLVFHFPRSIDGSLVNLAHGSDVGAYFKIPKISRFWKTVKF